MHLNLILGNHELYALEVLLYFTANLNRYNYHLFVSPEKNDILKEWMINGAQSTLDEFEKLSDKKKCDLISWLQTLPYYKRITINNQNYFLAHTMLPDLEELEKLTPFQVLRQMRRLDYSKQYYENEIFISGHTPTHFISSKYENKIFENEYHINVDCGSKVLACLCLDTMEEFYV